jgi:hypothetical protein
LTLRISRRAILLGLFGPLLLISCSDAASTQPFTPAPDRPTFIFFYAQGDGLWEEMRSIVDEVRMRYQDRVAFAYLDANGDGREAFARYGFVGHPGYILLRKDGSEAWRFLGVRTRAQFAAEIEQVLAGG